MNEQQLERFLSVLRREADRAGLYPQWTGQYGSSAFLRRENWRWWWVLSETARLAERTPWTDAILWDEPARPVVLHYAREAA